MSLKLAARLVTVEPYKFADIQENDTATHLVDLSSILPPGSKAIIFKAERISGTGNLYAYPVSGATLVTLLSGQYACLIPIKNRELKWSFSVANDDWDLTLFGYFVQKRTR